MNVKEAVLLSRETGGAVKVSLERVDVDVRVKDVSSAVTITQAYRNTDNKAIEAVYCFPVEESAAVCGFEIETGGKIIRGIAEEKEKAFETYDKAISEGDAAYLLDQESQDIMHISVGNIKPGQEAVIRISYVSELPVTDGVIRLQIPATVSPRYAPADSDPVAVDRINPPRAFSVPYMMAITVRAARASIIGAESPSHTITAVEEGEDLIVRLAEGGAALDKDFILEMETARKPEPFCIAARHRNGDTAMLMRFYPELGELTKNTARRSEIIFLIDCSGSMQGSSISEAKQAMELSLRSLNEGDIFNIVRFGSTYEVFAGDSQVFGGQTLRTALAYIDGTSASLGGTELLPAMRFACSLPKREGFLRDVVLITDGEVSNPDDVIAAAADHYGSVRVFSFGIGYGASHHLVKGTARASGGAWEMIQPGEKVQPKVLRQFSRMSQPFLADIAVTGSGVELEVPYKLPPLFEDDSYTVYCRIRNPKPDAEVTFSGAYLGSRYAWKAALGPVKDDDAVPALWALYHIKMMKEGLTGGSSQPGRGEQLTVKRITDLGLRFNLMTDYTSFFAVEGREGGEKTTGQPEFRRIPVLLTKDWHGTAENEGGDNLALMSGAPIPAMPIVFDHRTFGPGLFAKTAMGKKLKKAARRDMGQGMANGKKSASGGKSDFFSGPGTDSALSFQRADEKPEAGGAHGTKEASSEWYLDLLGTQEAAGYFMGLDVCAKRLGIDAGTLKDAALKIDNLDENLKVKVFTTWFAVRLLERDPELKNVCGRAIRKATAWLKGVFPPAETAGTGSGTALRDGAAPEPSIAGMPADKYLLTMYKISI